MTLVMHIYIRQHDHSLMKVMYLVAIRPENILKDLEWTKYIDLQAAPRNPLFNANFQSILPSWHKPHVCVVVFNCSLLCMYVILYPGHMALILIWISSFTDYYSMIDFHNHGQLYHNFNTFRPELVWSLTANANIQLNIVKQEFSNLWLMTD